MANEQLRIQDDLYSFINQAWIDQAVIPDDKPACGGFNELNTQVEELLMSDLEKMRKGTLPCDDPNLQKAVALYALAKDVKKRDRQGIRPVMPDLHLIDKLHSPASLSRRMKDFMLRDLPMPLVCGVMPDMKDTSRHAVLVGGPKTILPDVAYYKPGMEQQKQALLGVWTGMAAQLLARTDLTPEDQKQYVQDALAFDEKIAALIKSSEEWSDYVAIYNPMKTSRVASLLKPLNFRALLRELFGDQAPETIIVAEPRFLKGFKTLFNAQTFPLYKHWAYVRQLIGASGLLSQELREIGSAYARMLSGVASLPSIEKEAYQLASSMYSEPLGIYYGRTYFGEEAKHDVEEMVRQIIDTYKDRVRRNDFLTDATKEKAILKLSKMEVKMGYPDRADKLYDELNFEPRWSLYKVMSVLGTIRNQDNVSKLTQSVDRTKWELPGHMVNACYSPFTNDITFPAAILQAPFYSLKQSRSENLGGIGGVIGHEISHAFDTNGAKCDENGNLNNWWTKEDFRKFKARSKAMIREFDGIELPWGKVNSAMVVSENIADNGGMAVTLEIMSKMPDADLQAYFYNWARVWCQKARPEFLQLLLQIDVHAPSVLRCNMQPRNFPEWYETFRVKKTDGMYLSPSKRVVIW